MAARTATAKTTKGAREKVQANAASSPKAVSRAAAAKTTAKAATGAKTTRGAREKVLPAKAAPAKRAAKTAAAPAPAPATTYPTSVGDKKPWTNGKKVNKKTGFTEGTISDIIATALLKGGKSRADIVNSLEGLPTETKKGTKFQAANVAATVERQMRAMGFEVVQSYKIVPPKRGATK